MTTTRTTQTVRIIGPKVYAWGSYGLTPTDPRGQHEPLINVWTRIAPDGTITRHTSRERARRERS